MAPDLPAVATFQEAKPSIAPVENGTHPCGWGSDRLPRLGIEGLIPGGMI